MTANVGMGYDVHRLTLGRKLILGGVEIPYEKGLEGHSDADVLIHAVCDALLGALGKGDIGEHFPDTDSRYKGISSLVLLGHVANLVQEEGFVIQNIDTVILAQEPNLKAYKGRMRFNIAYQLAIDESLVNIKATTQEGLGFIGHKEGIAAYAVAAIAKKMSNI